jgi:hypothetical protein
MESIMVLISQEIPPSSLFLFPFWEFFSLSFYTPTTMITRPRTNIHTLTSFTYVITLDMQPDSLIGSSVAGAWLGSAEPWLLSRGKPS